VDNHLTLLDDASQESMWASDALGKIPAMLEGMKSAGVDVSALSCSIVADQGDIFVVPEYRKTGTGWMPILDWPFVSFDPTRWGYAVPLTGGSWDDILRKRRERRIRHDQK
jgi:hypothetical protein